jgi:hypothetical protein
VTVRRHADDRFCGPQRAALGSRPTRAPYGAVTAAVLVLTAVLGCQRTAPVPARCQRICAHAVPAAGCLARCTEIVRHHYPEDSR